MPQTILWLYDGVFTAGVSLPASTRQLRNMLTMARCSSLQQFDNWNNEMRKAMNYYHRWEYQILTHISLQLQTPVLWYIVHMCTDHQVWSVQCDMLSWCLKPPCRWSCSDARCREWQLIEEGITDWSQIKEETWISWKKQISCLITPSTFSYLAFTDNSAQTAFKCR